MTYRIILSMENLRDLFQVELQHIRMWTRLGILPSIEGRSPISYDKAVVDKWLADGNLEKHRPITYYHRKGIYGKPPKGK